jgi:mycofactocin glycosyltransferase
MVSRVEGERPPRGTPAVRPRVSVIIPFAGSPAAINQLLSNLQDLEHRPDDELIVVDNRQVGAAPWPPMPPGIRVLEANTIASPAFARNEGARMAAGEWLVFLDADTRPATALLDAYFTPPPSPATAVLAGGILDVAAEQTLVARRDVARRRWSQDNTVRRPGAPYAQTGNCAVLRAAFERVGGFDEQARAGEDADLCFRIQHSGWALEERPAAVVEHPAASTLRAWVVQQIRHGSGAAWANRRWPGEFPAPGPRWMVVRTLRLVRQAIGHLSRGEVEQAAFALLDLLGACALDLGRLVPNRPIRPRHP